MKMEHTRKISKRKIVIVVILFLCLEIAATGWLFFKFGYRLARTHYNFSSQVSNIHLNRYNHFTHVMGSRDIEFQLLHFRSDFDQTIQSITIMRPAARKPDKLFFFFHGMDGDAGDAMVVGDLVEKNNAKIVAMGGRGPSWVSDAWLADASQIIRQYKADFDGFYLTGISMGGTQSLALAGLLPEDLRRFVLGVISLMPSADLNFSAAHSTVERVSQTLRNSVGAHEEKLKQRSPLSLTQQYKPGLPFVIFFQENDTTLSVPPVKEFIRLIRRAGHPVSVFSASGKHVFQYFNFPYQEVFESLGKNTDHPLKGIS